MGSSALTVALAVAVTSLGQYGAIQQKEIDYQNQAFKTWWGTDLVWRFDDLPEKGSVPKFRVPYSGYDYPDRGGGTANALWKYDRAFNRGSGMAVAYEQQDTSQTEETVRRGPIFGIFQVRVNETPGWYGHCNGRTAASMRHAEPQKSVTRNGVRFTPADIKGLLAEVYMYNQTEFLGGVDTPINPGTFHVTLANWVGLGKHPVGMDTTPGKVVWNYPIYSYACSYAKRGDRQVEVKTNVGYIKSTNREYDKAPSVTGIMYFHYILDLDEEGKIVGGRYTGRSNQIDMLWAPRQPVQARKKGNERGNPYLDVKKVLAIWRDSVPEDVRKQWFNIDPTDEDRILEPGEEAELAASANQPADATGDGTSSTETDAGGVGVPGPDVEMMFPPPNTTPPRPGRLFGRPRTRYPVPMTIE
jgi:hypothetical protein